MVSAALEPSRCPREANYAKRSPEKASLRPPPSSKTLGLAESCHERGLRHTYDLTRVTEVVQAGALLIRGRMSPPRRLLQDNALRAFLLLEQRGGLTASASLQYVTHALIDLRKPGLDRKLDESAYRFDAVCLPSPARTYSCCSPAVCAFPGGDYHSLATPSAGG